MDAEPLGDVASAPPPDPKLFATYDGSLGQPKGPAMGTEAGPMGKLKDKITGSEPSS
jgi:Mn-containing catalase